MAQRAAPVEEPEWGVTFSTIQAGRYGVDWKEAYIASLDDLGIRHYRIPVYWYDIEPNPGEYHFDDIDFILDEAKKRGATITLAIGQKVPRWPECFIPGWAEEQSDELRGQSLLHTIRVIVNRYKTHPAVSRWQVENEPFFSFGECPEPNYQLVYREIGAVRAVDDRPIMTTVSGELEPWNNGAALADVVGISMYRVTWNKMFGYFFYPLSPSFYRARAKVISSQVDKLIISELQAEPWFYKPYTEMTAEERREAFSVQLFENNIEFARRTQLSEALLWGVEWWYLEKQEGRPELWNRAKELYRGE